MMIAYFIGTFNGVYSQSPYQESDVVEELIYGDITESGGKFITAANREKISELVKEVAALPNVIYTTSLSMRSNIFDDVLAKVSMTKKGDKYDACTIERLQAVIEQSKLHPDTVLITCHMGRSDFLVCRLPKDQLEDRVLTPMIRRITIDNMLKDLQG